MQDYNPIQPTALISQSRSTINNNMDSIVSHFSGSYFPTNNLQAGMYCWRTDVKQMYQLNDDLVNWTLVNDMSQGYNSVAHANRADYATKDANGNDIATTYSKQTETDKIVLQCYPVGSIYMSVVATDPALLFGGTWQRIADGRVLIGASSGYPAGTVGGSETQDVTLSTANIPSHNHSATVSSDGAHNHTGTTQGAGTHNHGLRATLSGGSSATWVMQATNSSWGWQQSTGDAGNHTHNFTTSSVGNHSHIVNIANTGNGESFNISHVQPYLSVYIWKRIA